MANHPSGSGREGLERSCDEKSPDWIRQTDVADGLELFEAWFQGPAYRQHRHDTYAIGLTERGVQAFSYRGERHVSMPGEVVVLHPDELHDGYAGSEAGFGYRLLYVEPALIFDAARLLSDQRAALPFVPHPVVSSPALATAIQAAFQEGREPLASDDIVLRLAEGLLAADPASGLAHALRRLDVVAIDRARQFLDAEMSRVVRSWELEAVSGLSRFDLARQFRAVLGTSPYRYSLMRRLEAARAQLGQHRSLVEVALEAGFADQAHFTRMFTASFGISPARYRALSESRGRGVEESRGRGVEEPIADSR